MTTENENSQSPKRINDDLEEFVQKSNGFGLKIGGEKLGTDETNDVQNEESFENQIALHLPIHSKNNTSKSNKKYQKAIARLQETHMK